MRKLKSICLIDDDSTTNLINEILIKDLNLAEDVLIFEDAEMALNDLEKLVKINECPSLIFLDINMPIFDSYDFLDVFEKIRNLDRTKVILIILSAKYRQSDFEILQNFKVDEILEKPLTKEKLRSLGKKYLFLIQERNSCPIE